MNDEKSILAPLGAERAQERHLSAFWRTPGTGVIHRVTIDEFLDKTDYFMDESHVRGKKWIICEARRIIGELQKALREPVAPVVAQEPGPHEGEVWKASDGRRLRVIGRRDQRGRVAVRNVATNRLTYMQARYFNGAREGRWFLERVPPILPNLLPSSPSSGSAHEKNETTTTP